MTTPGPTVAEVMLHRPAVSSATASVAEVRALLTDSHIHAALLVDDGRLVALVDRGDIEGARDEVPARELGGLAGRTVSPDLDAEELRRRMTGEGSRRLAVVDEAGVLLGLLCLKRHGRGFCSDAEVAERAAERRCVED